MSCVFCIHRSCQDSEGSRCSMTFKRLRKVFPEDMAKVRAASAPGRVILLVARRLRMARMFRTGNNRHAAASRG